MSADTVQTVQPTVAAPAADDVLPLTPVEQRELLAAVREIRDTVREVRAFADTIPDRVDSMPPMLKMMMGGLLK